MRERKCKDIEITFVGMAFIIEGCLRVIKEAVEIVTGIEPVNCMWVIMPWKVQEQIAKGEEMAEHFKKIEQYNVHLQNAVSVASYAVSLEQLENVLNASNFLESLAMR